ncbi:GNAT family N-acetyltransferase [Enterococcus faecium]|uniref:GNAT family N-acetyltransferase n=1 Tax=Enterococcus TaxID=1350 RepID=UPI00093732BA|nr:MULTISPECIES: GNAT family N-acetyltransferase [Enterococcus]EME8238850.1 GNAT family N-acetyltransferase [Enterococcus faecium]EME8264220.1 GNAT family N-acetyltransferase [Enterococcus faecium]MDG4617953.1 GNAT family N-acetyltransferase [Enterococcus lactis]MDV4765686.1 GNAT family N-acetyltransferase [Enterococcus faecium]MEB4751029.1 GNAT family N-acetyltransferase [Enterococcus sp. E5-162]
MNVDSLMIDEISELYKSVGWTHYTKDTARLEKAFEQSESLIKRNGEGKIIGVVRWITDCATIAFIQDILIHPRYQRQGIGKALLHEVLEKITSYGPVQIELLTDDTEKTKKFYESVGFVQVKEMDAVSYIKDTRR